MSIQQSSIEVNSKRAPQFTNQSDVEVIIAPNAGACFGVVRAIKLGQQAAKKGEKNNAPVFALGALVHNPQTLEALKASGVKTVESETEISQGTAILRSHGVKQEIEKDLRDRGIQIVDATCPLVKKPQRIAQGLSEKGYFLVLVGDSKHPEVKGVVSYFGRPEYLVTYNPEDIAKIPEGVEKVGIIAQTTIEVGMLNKIVDACRARFSDVSVHNTICDATSIRQGEVEVLAKEADLMLVVGGKTSSNTNKLVKICMKYQPETFLIENIEEINPDWLQGKKKIGITGGASTPQDYVDSVGEFIACLLEAKITSENSLSDKSH